MSASKAALGVGSRERPRDVSGAHRCPVCGRESWCQVYSDGTTLCKRVPSPRRKVNADGVEFYVHRGEGAVERAPLPPPPAAPRADDDALHEAYSAGLARMPLLETHRADLRARGLDDVTIRRNGYRSLQVSGRAALARVIVATVGEHAALGVPGVTWREDGGRRWLSLAGAPGLLVPVRDLAGRVVALKVRADAPGDGPKYTYLSSRRHGGPGARNVVHVPHFNGDRAVVRVTEGELKADVVTALTRTLTISVPGVGSWRKALPVLRALGARTVKVAFDADHRTNPVVGRAMAALVHALRDHAFTTVLETWPASLGKGLDDVLVAPRRCA